MPEKYHWWQIGTIYQIYPRSFLDTNGDGIGDLQGIRDRLAYLRWLGVEILWLCPIYPSPMADFGYDISNYTDVDPLFGTLAQFDSLLSEAHRLGFKVLLDFVPNHTSDDHPWFRESRASRDNPKRNWYIWRDASATGGPPNNWLSSFGGSAWQLDAVTGQYYYHAFLDRQPDLNWRNPDVQSAMLDVLRFWLRRGVDGFRIDVIWHIIKDDQFRDNPANPSYTPTQSPNNQLIDEYSSDQPEVHAIISKIRAVLDEFPDRMMVGEIYLPVDRLVTYYGAGGSGVHLPFNFQLIELPWNPRIIAHAVQHYEKMLPAHGWPNWVLGNHDKPRIARRAGTAQARVAAMLLFTLRGTPTHYYGDEIGMEDTPIPPDAVRDPFEKNVPGLGLGRDPARTPMQWDTTRNAGFTTGFPWLPVASNYQQVNVVKLSADPTSILSLYRKLISLRKTEPALTIGSYVGLPENDSTMAYIRQHGDDEYLIVLNFTSGEQTFQIAERPLHGKVALSTNMDRGDEQVHEVLHLRPNEGMIVKLL